MGRTATVHVESLLEFFRINRVLVYAIYGLVFILMGVSIAVQSMKHTRLALGKHLWLLALFGITHGFTEWGDVFIPIQATYVSPKLVTVLELLQFGLLTFSFLALLLFACYLLLGPERSRFAPVIAFGVGLSAALLAATTSFIYGGLSAEHFHINGEVWVRYLIGLPAAAGAGLALYEQARIVEAQAMPRIARWLRIAAWAFGGYAFLTGLVTPTQTLLRYPWVNHVSSEGFFGMPLPLLRAMPAAVVAYYVIKSLHLFQIETDRMLDEARQEKLLVAERELATMSDIAVALGGSRTPETIPEEVLRRILDLLKLHPGRAVLCSPAGETLAEAGDGVTNPCTAHLGDVLTSTIEQGRVVTLPQPDGSLHIGIPVTAKQQMLAVLTLSGFGPVHLSEQEQQCLISVGNQIGIALENARLWREVQQKEALRSELMGRIIRAQEEERIRVARELHDEVGQTLSGLVVRAGAAVEALPENAARAHWILEGIRELLTSGIDELRNLIMRLRPAALDDLGLVPALRRLGRQLGQDYGFDFSLRASAMSHRLPRPLETVLFRVAQEALTNVAKHASARTATITLTMKGDHVEAVVVDDGKGFKVERTPGTTNTRCFGLLGMQERASLCGGTLEITSEPGLGTQILVRVPLSGGGIANEQPESHSAGG